MTLKFTASHISPVQKPCLGSKDSQHHARLRTATRRGVARMHLRSELMAVRASVVFLTSPSSPYESDRSGSRSAESWGAQFEDVRGLDGWAGPLLVAATISPRLQATAARYRHGFPLYHQSLLRTMPCPLSCEAR